MVTPFIRYVRAGSFRQLLVRHPLLEIPEGPVPRYGIVPGEGAYIITGDRPGQLQQMEFGLRGAGPVLPFVRAEGNRNPEDDLRYRGARAIFLQPQFRKLIRYHRCLVPADAFVAGMPQEPWLVYLRNRQRPFCFAGIWNRSPGGEGGETGSFAIITVPANEFLAGLGVRRMPVILPFSGEATWLKATAPLSAITRMLEACPARLMNASRVEQVSAEAADTVSAIRPLGKPVFDETINLQLPKKAKAKSFTTRVQLSERGMQA